MNNGMIVVLFHLPAHLSVQFRVGSKLSNCRLKQLDKHNNLIGRVCLIEKHESTLKNKFKTADHRISDLENEQNRERTM